MTYRTRKSRGDGFFLCLVYITAGTVTGLKSDFLYYLELEESGKQQFVDSHNHFRRLVSNPEAANMKLITWDEELAELARNHVRKCKAYYSSPSELKTVHFTRVGENIYAGEEFFYDQLMTTTGVTKKWYNEVKDFDYDGVSCASGKICSHYTQVVWAQSYKVGCAVASCRKIEGGHTPYLVTCAYGPGGNVFFGKPLSPYVSGEACSACEHGDLCIDQLCNNTDRDIPFTTTATTPDVTTAISTAANISAADASTTNGSKRMHRITWSGVIFLTLFLLFGWVCNAFGGRQRHNDHADRSNLDGHDPGSMTSTSPRQPGETVRTPLLSQTRIARRYTLA